MEPFEIQPNVYVEKQKEVIHQLTEENILLSCRVDQLEIELTLSDKRLVDLERDGMEKDVSEVSTQTVSTTFGTAEDPFPNQPTTMERMDSLQSVKAEPNSVGWSLGEGPNTPLG